MIKKICCVLLLAIISITAYSQKIVPVIKQGTVINYIFHLHGQQSTFTIEVKNIADTLALRWTIRGLAGGGYLISPAAWNQGNRLNFAQPIPNVTVKLPPDQTFCMISKNAFKDLLKKHQFMYDNTMYDLKEDATEGTVMSGNQPLDVLHVVAENETTEFWILNNPDFPFICCIKGNPLGIDIDLNSIKP